MDVSFKKVVCDCLDAAVREVRSTEVTQEIKLPDSMPDVGRVVSAWGQAILRSKEWNADRISISGGLMVWVLYAPEDGSTERCLDTWIPFQMQWELPENTVQGEIRVRLQVRFVDGRSISARKIMVRAGVAALTEALVPGELQVYTVDGPQKEVELLKNTYPLRLNREAGERSILIEEELSLPDAAPKPEALLYYRMEPRVTDKKVLSNKVVFRGNGNLHVLYRSEEGQVHSWDFDLPFSQYAQLNQEHSSDAQADFLLSPTGLELELDQEGMLRVKGGIAAQYLISDKQLLELVEDAYSPGREVRVSAQSLEIPVVLENRRENLYAEQTIDAPADIAADVSFLPDFPRQRQSEHGVDIITPGTFQILYYGEDGSLNATSSRWEGLQKMSAHEDTTLTAAAQYSVPMAVVGSGQIMVKTEMPLEVTATARQKLDMVTDVELGEVRQRDAGRPTLILRRAGDQRLWDIAKRSGSTVDTIRRINGLQSEPAPEQILLIPVS